MNQTAIIISFFVLELAIVGFALIVGGLYAH